MGQLGPDLDEPNKEETPPPLTLCFYISVCLQSLFNLSSVNKKIETIAPTPHSTLGSWVQNQPFFVVTGACAL